MSNIIVDISQNGIPTGGITMSDEQYYGIYSVFQTGSIVVPRGSKLALLSFSSGANVLISTTGIPESPGGTLVKHNAVLNLERIDVTNVENLYFLSILDSILSVMFYD